MAARVGSTAADSLPRAFRPSVALVPALALPLLFLHVQYQPSVDLGAGSSHVSVALSDVAVAAVVLTALAAGTRTRFRELRGGLWLWATTAALLVWIVVTTVHGHLLSSAYPFGTHLVTAAKFWEYALLAPALAVLVRSRADLGLVLASLSLWSAAATAVGVLQFAGVNIVGAWPRGWRQPSFLGVHDFAALSAAALAVAVSAIALRTGQDRRVTRVAGIAGAVGLVLAGTVAVVGGTLLAIVVVALLARRLGTLGRRGAAWLAVVSVLVALGTLGLRGNDISQFLGFLGVRKAQPTSSQHVQTYAQRTVLAYIGLRIFLAHPVLGAGWHASTDEWAYGPYLAAAHRRFPTASAEGLPSPAHPWGLQSAYVQALADMGAIGLVVFLSVFAAGVAVGVRVLLRGPPDAREPAAIGIAWTLICTGAWAGLNLDAGLPLDALTWLAIGVLGFAAAAPCVSAPSAP